VADEYERKQMPGVGEMLLRRKVTSPRWLMGLMVGLPLAIGGVLGALTVIPGLATGDVLPFALSGLAVFGGGAALSAIFALLNALFASARIAVSTGEIHVQLGMAGPKIPIAEVQSVALAPSGSHRMGMGVRNDLRGTTTYTLWGENDRAVHITRTDGRKLVLVIRDAEAIVRAIEEAMAHRDRQVPRARVEVAAEREHEESADDIARTEDERRLTRSR
jgi:hypothetical protein